MECTYCDRKFTPTRPWHRFCSASCRNKEFSRRTFRNRKKPVPGERPRTQSRHTQQELLFSDDRKQELSVAEQLAAIDRMCE